MELKNVKSINEIKEEIETEIKIFSLFKQLTLEDKEKLIFLFDSALKLKA